MISIIDTNTNMKRIKLKKHIIPAVIFLGLVFCVFGPVNISYACTSGTSTYCLLAPIPGFGDAVDTTQGVGNYLNAMIKIIIGFMSVLAVVMLVVGGIQYMVSNIAGEKASAKSRMTNAIFGLILALSSYLILNTLNPNLVNLKIGLRSTTIQEFIDDPDAPDLTLTKTTLKDANGNYVNAGDTLCNSNHDSHGILVHGVVPVTVKVDNGAPQLQNMTIKSGGPWPYDDGRDLVLRANEANMAFPQLHATLGMTVVGVDYRSGLTSRGIVIKPGELMRVGDTGVTSLYALSSAAQNGLISLKNDCDTYEGGAGKCELVVTGGTECWLHKTHGPGLDSVDLRKTNTLNDFLLKKAGVPPAPDRRDYKYGSINIFNEDSAHVHIKSW